VVPLFTDGQPAGALVGSFTRLAGNRIQRSVVATAEQLAAHAGLALRNAWLLQDVEELEPAVQEAARVLAPGGRLCLAIVHPLNSAGRFRGDSAESPFVIEDSYLDRSYYADDLARDGLEMTFVSAHRPLQAYTEALAEAGLLIERLREPALPANAVSVPRSLRWQRVPLFLQLRALKPAPAQ